MANRRFDDIIKKKLESFKTDYVPETWDDLMAKMAMDAELGDDFEDQEFDDVIKDKVDSYHSDYNPDTWEELAAMMELNAFEEEILDQHFDQSVQTKMEQYSIPLTGNNWELLRERMEKEAQLRTQVYIAKAAEVLIIFLLIFTVYRLLPSRTIENLHPKSEFAQFQANDEFQNTILANQDNLIIQTADIDKTRQEILAPNNLSRNPSTETLALGSLEIKPNASTVFEQKEKLNQFAKINSLVVNHINYSRDIIINETHSRSQNIFDQNILNQDYISQNNSHALFASVNKLDMIPSRGIDYTSEFNNIGLSLITLEKAPRTKIWLNGFIAADAMLINTPFDAVYNAPAFNKAAAGFSAGVSISAQRGSIELDAGLSYSSKGYQPQLIRELNGTLEANYVERSLTNIIFDMAQLNFNIKHHFFKNKKIQIYVMAGSSFNLITYTEYNFEEKPRSVNGAPLLTPIQTKLLDQKNFEKGALEGGDLISNSFFTINAGIGIQHNVNKRLAFFFQPNYQRHILDGGIGPNNDRIHNLSLQMGTKLLLSK